MAWVAFLREPGCSWTLGGWGVVSGLTGPCRWHASMTIETSTKRLQDLLSKSQTSDLLRSAAVQLLTVFSTDISGSGLVSPYKQVFHLLGLMLATDPEPVCEPIDARRWKDIQETLNEVFQEYALVFFPKKRELITKEWQRAREVAMPAFLEYFNTLR